MSSRGKTQRFFIITIVVVFVVSTLGFTGLVVWDLSRNKSDPGQDVQKQLQEEFEKSQGPKLEGTKLENFTPIEKVDSLKVIDIQVGDGKEVSQGGTITAHYTGALAKDGTVFQSSKDTGQPITSALDGVIKGWQEGIPGMKVGGKRRLIIPAALAYGEQSPAPNIPPNSDLVFDIELLDLP
jgi:peptidylprolyl isomerase